MKGVAMNQSVLRPVFKRSRWWTHWTSITVSSCHNLWDIGDDSWINAMVLAWDCLKFDFARKQLKRQPLSKLRTWSKCWSWSGKIWSSRCAGDSCRLCSSARLGGIQPHISCWNSFPVEVAGAPEEETNAINLLDPYRPFNLDFRWLQPV